MKHLLIYINKLREFAGFKLYVNLVGMTLISFLEGIGIFLLVPALGLIGIFHLDTSGIPFVSYLVEPLQAVPERARLSVLLGGFILLIAGQALMQRKQTNLNLEIQHGFIRYLRVDIYKGLLQADWAFFLRNRRSDFTHVMTNELMRVSMSTYLALRLITTLLFTAVQIGFALWLSVQLTAMVLICGLAVALYSSKFIKRSKSIGDETSELAQNYIGGMTDHFNGMKDIKSNMTEAQHLTWFRALCEKMETNLVQFGKTQSASQYVYKVASAVLISLFVFLSLEVFHIPAEKLVLIIVIFSRLWPKFSTLQANWEQIAQSLPAFKSLADLQRDCAQARELDDLDRVPQGSRVRMKQGIECRGIHYRYDAGGSAYALRNINLSIPVNSMTAIVGKSGAGKSTLIDILIGLIKPEEGEVLVDGESLAHDDGFSLRRSVSYVSQDPFLFHASIRENLLIASPEASEEQMWEALEFAASAEFVRNLPLGLDAVLGDRGVRLSGGERQRIVLARAILRKPAILILDEATSALDSENEAKIQAALDRLKGRTTIVVIAHRLSTIRNADQVLVLENGQVIQRGGFQQLSADTKGTFSKLLEFQAGVHA
ncbi:ABC transporter ATP-binding protein [Paenibacillus glycinis]|uniref:ATP-binding cassette domain-containing protein n=1 Tax=Paenibacillus glycinis TaxID=2697035 RepID=A0ABW9XUK8_9BACL|nr:ABC transporter ATP-binding protein [Paenibacillus glycinis]NBD26356.1 ATP-binding cassette domain-containing protein [Paenibacillus glycinis]